MATRITKVFLHHYGGTQANRLAKTSHLKLEDIERIHKEKHLGFQRRDPSWKAAKSEMGYYTAYTGIIFPDDSWVQTRLVGEETVAVRGHNFDAVHFCLAGNHLSEPPTWEQRTRAKNLITPLLNGRAGELKVKQGTIIDIPKTAIYPHRWGQPTTECNAMPMDWGYNLVRDELNSREEMIIKLRSLIEILRQLLSMRKLGGVGDNCLDSESWG